MDKICNKCGETKAYTEYNKQKDTKDGYYTYCKVCKNLMSQKYYKKNKSKLIAKGIQYYLENKDEVKKKVKAYREKNIEKYRKYNNKYQKKRYMTEDKREYTPEQKAKRYETSRKWLLEHPERRIEYNERHKKYEKDKRKKDRILARIRAFSNIRLID